MVAGFVVFKYFLNPYGVPTWDWRARLLGVTSYRMPSRSMEPTLRDGAIFWVDSAVLRERAPRAQEIVVFRYPPDPTVRFVKRIVAVGGQRLDEPYLPAIPLVPDGSDSFPAVLVPAGSYFVLGDNRGNSADSRVRGFVLRDHVIGIYNPADR